MNIVEAAQQVVIGLLVRRSSWHPESYMGLDGTGLYIVTKSVQVHFSLSIQELLALDWELYQVAHKRGLSLKKK